MKKNQKLTDKQVQEGNQKSNSDSESYSHLKPLDQNDLDPENIVEFRSITSLTKDEIDELLRGME